ncbi:TonB-dependent receptor [Terriglobus sp. 2YAB30_2]|uniref:TonB-dependent receptor n=1 Tax=Terriglobus sp. 2YAB30_2 TaxID=3233023 RepID=UPI003F9E0119
MDNKNANSKLRAGRVRLTNSFHRFFFGAVVLLAATAVTFGQSSSGMRGRVVDSSGAVVPHVQVIVRNLDTGVDKQTETTGAGEYSVPFLPVGRYEVRVNAVGFQVSQQTNLTLTTNQILDVSFRLQPGAVTETINVDSSAQVLDYDKADRGDLIEAKRIAELPVNTGNTFNLATLSAGVTSTTTGQRYDNQSAQSLAIHGASVEFNIDGVTNYSLTGGQNYAFPPPTATVQEFKITTNAFDAASGRAPGGSIDMTLKSGTQKLHGTVYEILQRVFMNANTSTNGAFIQQATAAGNPIAQYNKPASSQDQYGFEVDGPVIIPKLWGPEKKTFFTISYERFYLRGVGNAAASVPLPAMINGDFSSLLTANGATYNQPIYDPTSEASCTANNTDNGTYSNGKPHTCRYQFGYGPGGAPGPQGNPVLTGRANVISAGRLNPVGQAILSWFPAPNISPTPTTANNFSNNYLGTTPGTALQRLYLIKVDQNIGDKDTANVTLKLWTDNNTANGAFPRNDVNAAHPGLNYAASIAHYLSRYKNPSGTVAWTHTFSPHLVNNVKVSILVTNQTDSTGPGNGFNPTSLGLPASISAANPNYFNRFPLVNLTGYNALGSIAGLNRGDNELQFTDVVNLVRGNHSIHFGADLRPIQYSQRSSNAAGSGLTFTVGKAWTQQWDTVVTGGATNISTAAGYSGNALASLLTGTLDSGSAGSQPDNYFSSHYYAGFVQDDWKIRPNLTLNLGLRWESLGAPVDRHNRTISAFDTTSTNPISSQVNFSGLPISTLLGGITFAGVNGRPPAPFEAALSQFGPRAAFAYTAHRNLVVRGGIGVYYQQTGSGNQYAAPQTGFATTTNYVGSFDGGATPLHNLSNPFPTFQTSVGNCGGDASACLTTNAGQGLSFINPNYRPPLVLMSAFGVQQQLTKWDTLEISYAGNRTYGLTYSDDLNHIGAAAQAACDPKRGGVGTNCTNGASNGTVGYINNPFKGIPAFAGTAYYTASTIQRINFTRPFPQFTNVTETLLNGGEYYYNALEATYNHRTSLGLTLHATYTYSKAISAAGYTDTINRIPSRTISGTDIPHRITISGVYQLPIERGHGIFPNLNQYLDYIIGGWQVSSIMTYQSGLPFNITGYEIDSTANGGYILPRQRFFPGQPNPYHTQANSNSYVQAFKPCVGTRDPNTGVVTLQAYSVTAGCTGANFISIGTYGVVPNTVYTGIRLQQFVNIDANISKNFHIYERIAAQLRLDAFNAANHVTQFSSGYNTTAGDANFGTYQMGTAAGGNISNRILQITGRINF